MVGVASKGDGVEIKRKRTAERVFNEHFCCMLSRNEHNQPAHGNGTLHLLWHEFRLELET